MSERQLQWTMDGIFMWAQPLFITKYYSCFNEINRRIRFLDRRLNLIYFYPLMRCYKFKDFSQSFRFFFSELAISIVRNVLCLVIFAQLLDQVSTLYLLRQLQCTSVYISYTYDNCLAKFLTEACWHGLEGSGIIGDCPSICNNLSDSDEGRCRDKCPGTHADGSDNGWDTLLMFLYSLGAGSMRSTPAAPQIPPI